MTHFGLDVQSNISGVDITLNERGVQVLGAVHLKDILTLFVL